MRIFALVALTVALAACGSATPATSPAQHTALPTAGASPTPPPSATGGNGNTTANPDSASQDCEFAGAPNQPNQVEVYVVIAGPEPAPLCEYFGSLTDYQTVHLSAVPTSAVGCWMTSADGKATARIYTAPDGNSKDTSSECSVQIQDVAVSGS